MNVFSKIGSFVNRHRKKFITGGVIVTGTILLAKYGQQKLKEWQENQAKEFLDRTRKQHHFENTERTCNQTILKLLPSLEEHLASALNTEAIIAELRNSPDNKLELWEKLKLLVFTRASCAIYATVLMVVMLRVQLNILGGHLFKKTLEIETEIQEKYLLLCNNLMEVGVKNIADVIESKFKDIVGPMDLKRKLSLKNLEDIFWAVQSTVATSDNNPLDNISRHFITEIPLEKSLFTEMVLDTIDILDSDEVKSISVHCINRGFALLSDQLADYYVPSAKIEELPSNSNNIDFVSPLNIEIPMAKLIPIINGLFAKKFPNTLLQQLLCNDKIKVLGANIYESFSHV